VCKIKHGTRKDGTYRRLIDNLTLELLEKGENHDTVYQCLLRREPPGERSVELGFGKEGKRLNDVPISMPYPWPSDLTLVHDLTGQEYPVGTMTPAEWAVPDVGAERSPHLAVRRRDDEGRQKVVLTFSSNSVNDIRGEIRQLSKNEYRQWRKCGEKITDSTRELEQTIERIEKKKKQKAKQADIKAAETELERLRNDMETGTKERKQLRSQLDARLKELEEELDDAAAALEEKAQFTLRDIWGHPVAKIKVEFKTCHPKVIGNIKLE